MYVSKHSTVKNFHEGKNLLPPTVNFYHTCNKFRFGYNYAFTPSEFPRKCTHNFRSNPAIRLFRQKKINYKISTCTQHLQNDEIRKVSHVLRLRKYT